jgi:hypothetical protein
MLCHYDVWQRRGIGRDLFSVNNAGDVKPAVTDINSNSSHGKPGVEYSMENNSLFIRSGSNLQIYISNRANRLLTWREK